jgi:BolA protein
MTVADQIREKLQSALRPRSLDVIDQSAQHRGHAGARPEGETHFRVTIVAGKFNGLSRVQRQKLVYGVLAEELAGPVHALSLALSTPEEAAGRNQK